MIFVQKNKEHDYCWIVCTSTFRGFILARKGVTMFPEQLKTLSEGKLVAHTQRYLRVLWKRITTGNLLGNAAMECASNFRCLF